MNLIKYDFTVSMKGKHQKISKTIMNKGQVLQRFQSYWHFCRTQVAADFCCQVSPSVLQFWMQKFKIKLKYTVITEK